MNQDTIMQTSAELSSRPKVMSWVAAGLTGLVVLFLAFDGITKVVRVTPVMEACQKMGIGPDMAVGIGILLLACTALYVTPKTAILGAILLTGYLGGAIATHVRVGSPLFSHILFPVYLAVLLWGGLYLRDERLRALIPLRR